MGEFVQFGRLIRAAALSAGGSAPRTRLNRAVRARTLFVAAIAMVAPAAGWLDVFIPVIITCELVILIVRLSSLEGEAKGG
jgi:hypothetical protein